MSNAATRPGTPKQQQVRARLEQLIAGLAPGEPLPVERDLARDLGVARMTLRRAVDSLVEESRLIRRQGSGTFVSAGKLTQRLAATSFSADMRARGMEPGSRTLLTRRFAAGMMLSSLLDVPPRTEVVHIRRLRLADGLPMAVEDLHVPSTVAPGLTGADLDGTSFYDLLAGRYHNPVVSGTQTAEPALVGAEDAELLGVEAGAPVFLFERTSRVATGEVAEFVRSLYRGDRYRIVADIFPPEPAAG
ncbi:GntR family transcriptional regulator [Nocardioides mesophilus]|uniref:GntR family transcriptional regulator n=1 Tax=Nocardioides mesophilus TaxID=433659 RepID=UPI001CB6C707|nr:GntR family transcriptional regulator [Nocardioides mesophilus]